jgi:hypothetical protein
VDYKSIGSQLGVEDLDTTMLDQPNTSPLKEAMELPLLKEVTGGDINMIATHTCQEVVDTTMHRGQGVADITMQLGQPKVVDTSMQLGQLEVVDTSMQPNQPKVADTTICTSQQVGDTTMDTNEQVVDSPIMHTCEHVVVVAITLLQNGGVVH